MTNRILLEGGGLLCAREAATYLRVSERHLYNLERQDGLPVVRIGRAKRYSRESLNEWVKQKEADHGKSRE